MLYFLYHGGYETGRNLSGELTKKMGSNFRAIKSLASIRKRFKKGDSLIRWGTTRRRERDNLFSRNGGMVLNSAESILRNTNKLNSLYLFRKAGLNISKIWTDKHSIDIFPVLGRDKNHTGGKDIVIIEGSSLKKYNDYSKIPNKDFYVEFLRSKTEYRVHVFNEEVIRVTKKVFRGHDKDGAYVEEKGVIKNDTFGWGHSHIELDEVSDDIKDASIKATKAIGLNFAAIDLLVGSSDGKPYILEANSSPRLNTIGLEIYVDKISELFKNKIHTNWGW